jgi:hypothetical protein
MPYFDNFGASNKPILPDAFPTPTYAFLGRVIRVYTDYYEVPKDSGQRQRVYPPGTIEVLQVSTGLVTELPAYPLDELSNTIPIINEYVDVYTIAPNFFYRRRNSVETINNSLRPAGDDPFSQIAPSTNTTDYKTGASTTTQVRKEVQQFEQTNFQTQYLNRLRYYEGDSLYQSRFGQSIRFSGYNNDKGSPAPTIIIRNRQSDMSNTQGGYKTVVEDINNDGSTIAISSGDYKSEFLPGKLKPVPEPNQGFFGKKKKNKKGESDFFIKPWTQEREWAYGDSYPKELTGDQIVITSDRLIFSSRVNEMFFFSKGDIGIFADDDIAVDVKNNIKVTTHNKGKIRIEATGGMIWLDAGVPNPANRKGFGVYLGHPETEGSEAEPVFKGQIAMEKLSTLLTELMDGLKNGKVYTPAGPTSGIDPIWNKRIAALAKEMLDAGTSKSVFVY